MFFGVKLNFFKIYLKYCSIEALFWPDSRGVYNSLKKNIKKIVRTPSTILFKNMIKIPFTQSFFDIVKHLKKIFALRVQIQNKPIFFGVLESKHSPIKMMGNDLKEKKYSWTDK